MACHAHSAPGSSLTVGGMIQCSHMHAGWGHGKYYGTSACQPTMPCWFVPCAAACHLHFSVTEPMLLQPGTRCSCASPRSRLRESMCPRPPPTPRRPTRPWCTCGPPSWKRLAGIWPSLPLSQCAPGAASLPYAALLQSSMPWHTLSRRPPPPPTRHACHCHSGGRLVLGMATIAVHPSHSAYLQQPQLCLTSGLGCLDSGSD